MIQQFDTRNKDIKVWINGELLHRDQAKISVFDSAGNHPRCNTSEPPPVGIAILFSP